MKPAYIALLIEALLTVTLAVGVGLLLGSLVNPAAGAGAALMVAAFVGFALVIAWEKGSS